MNFCGSHENQLQKLSSSAEVVQSLQFGNYKMNAVSIQVNQRYVPGSHCPDGSEAVGSIGSMSYM
jgi:hypothetical protein